MATTTMMCGTCGKVMQATTSRTPEGAWKCDCKEPKQKSRTTSPDEEYCRHGMAVDVCDACQEKSKSLEARAGDLLADLRMTCSCECEGDFQRDQHRIAEALRAVRAETWADAIGRAKVWDMEERYGSNPDIVQVLTDYSKLEENGDSTP
jgi:hypothetical protein